MARAIGTVLVTPADSTDLARREQLGLGTPYSVVYVLPKYRYPGPSHQEDKEYTTDTPLRRFCGLRRANYWCSVASAAH